MSNCPSCGTSGCYQGFTSVECTNPSCNHFSGAQCKTFIQEYFREKLLTCIGEHETLRSIELPPHFLVSYPEPDVVAVSLQLEGNKDLVYKIQF